MNITSAGERRELPLAEPGATSFRSEMNVTETPSPTSARPTAATPRVRARPNRIEPAPATSPPSATTRRGPSASTSTPVGTCMTV